MFRKEKTKQKPLTYEEKYLLEEIAMTKMLSKQHIPTLKMLLNLT